MVFFFYRRRNFSFSSRSRRRIIYPLGRDTILPSSRVTTEKAFSGEKERDRGTERERETGWRGGKYYIIRTRAETTIIHRHRAPGVSARRKLIRAAAPARKSRRRRYRRLTDGRNRTATAAACFACHRSRFPVHARFGTGPSSPSSRG